MRRSMRAPVANFDRNGGSPTVRQQRERQISIQYIGPDQIPGKTHVYMTLMEPRYELEVSRPDRA